MELDGIGLFVGFDDGFLTSAVERFSLEHNAKRWPFRGVARSAQSLCSPSLVELHLTAWRDRHRCSISGQQLLVESAIRLDEVAIMCDRVFVAPISNQAQQLYLGRLTELLACVVDSQKIDYCVFSATPHFPWDALLALVLRRQGVPVFGLGPTQVEGRIVVREMSENFGELMLISRASLGTETIGRISDGVIADILRSGRAHSTRLSNANRLLGGRRDRKHWSLWRFLTRRLMQFGSRHNGRRLVWSRAVHDGNYFLVMGRGRTTLFGIFRKFQLFWHLRLVRKLSVGISDRSGVLFLLNFQPERSTDPEASFRRHQLSGIRELRDTLDGGGFADLPIFVREHPRQLSRNDPDFRKVLTRSASFYREICLIDNVFLLDPCLDWQENMERWRLVACVNGSGSWEAAVAGKPSVTLVRTWHSGCAATPTLHEVGDQRRLEELVEMSVDGVKNAVSRFLREEAVSHAGCMDIAHVDPQDVATAEKDLVDLFGRIKDYVVKQKRTNLPDDSCDTPVAAP